MNVFSFGTRSNALNHINTRTTGETEPTPAAAEPPSWVPCTLDALASLSVASPSANPFAFNQTAPVEASFSSATHAFTAPTPFTSSSVPLDTSNSTNFGFLAAPSSNSFSFSAREYDPKEWTSYWEFIQVGIVEDRAKAMREKVSEREKVVDQIFSVQPSKQPGTGPILRASPSSIALICRFLTATELCRIYQTSRTIASAASNPLTSQHDIRMFVTESSGVKVLGPTGTFTQPLTLLQAISSKLFRHFRILQLNSPAHLPIRVSGSELGTSFASVLADARMPALHSLELSMDAKYWELIAKDDPLSYFAVSPPLPLSLFRLGAFECLRFLKVLKLTIPCELFRRMCEDEGNCLPAQFDLLQVNLIPSAKTGFLSHRLPDLLSSRQVKHFVFTSTDLENVTFLFEDLLIAAEIAAKDTLQSITLCGRVNSSQFHNGLVAAQNPLRTIQPMNEKLRHLRLVSVSGPSMSSIGQFFPKVESIELLEVRLSLKADGPTFVPWNMNRLLTLSINAQCTGDPNVIISFVTAGKLYRLERLRLFSIRHSTCDCQGLFESIPSLTELSLVRITVALPHKSFPLLTKLRLMKGTPWPYVPTVMKESYSQGSLQMHNESQEVLDLSEQFPSLTRLEVESTVDEYPLRWCNAFLTCKQLRMVKWNRHRARPPARLYSSFKRLQWNEVAIARRTALRHWDRMTSNDFIAIAHTTSGPLGCPFGCYQATTESGLFLHLQTASFQAGSTAQILRVEGDSSVPGALYRSSTCLAIFRIRGDRIIFRCSQPEFTYEYDGWIIRGTSDNPSCPERIIGWRRKVLTVHDHNEVPFEFIFRPNLSVAPRKVLSDLSSCDIMYTITGEPESDRLSSSTRTPSELIHEINQCRMKARDHGVWSAAAHEFGDGCDELDGGALDHMPPEPLST